MTEEKTEEEREDSMTVAYDLNPREEKDSATGR